MSVILTGLRSRSVGAGRFAKSSVWNLEPELELWLFER